MKNTLLFKYTFLVIFFCNLVFADTLTFDKVNKYFLNYAQHPERRDPDALQETKNLFNKEAANKQKIKIFLPLSMLNEKCLDRFTRFFEILTKDTMKLSGEGSTFYIKNASIVMRKPRKHTSISFPVLKIDYNEHIIIPYKFLPNYENELNQLLEDKENKHLHRLLIREYSNLYENHPMNISILRDPLNSFSSIDQGFRCQNIAILRKKAKPKIDRPFRCYVLRSHNFVISACLSDNQWGFKGIADENREKIINAAPFLDKLENGDKIFRKDAIYPYGELRISGKEKGRDLLLKGFFVRDEDEALCLILCELPEYKDTSGGYIKYSPVGNHEEIFKKVCTTKPLQYFINRKK